MYWLFANISYPEEFQAIMRANHAGMDDDGAASFAKAINNSAQKLAVG